MSRRLNQVSNEDISSEEEITSSSSSEDESNDQQRDLTNEEMEKLIQLQDLTGMFSTVPNCHVHKLIFFDKKIHPTCSY